MSLAEKHHKLHLKTKNDNTANKLLIGFHILFTNFSHKPSTVNKMLSDITVVSLVAKC